jgi:hypothetical protein
MGYMFAPAAIQTGRSRGALVRLTKAYSWLVASDHAGLRNGVFATMVKMLNNYPGDNSVLAKVVQDMQTFLHAFCDAGKIGRDLLLRLDP